MKLSKQRLEAFSDGVIAIIITIMVLNIPLPKTVDWNGFAELSETVFVYFISFIVVGAFWYQHYKVFDYIKEVTKRIVAINLLFLFFLSLIPILSKWVIANPKNISPAIGFDIVYLFINFTYMIFFRYALLTSDHEKIEKIKEKRSKINENTPHIFFWMRLLFPLSIVIILIFIAIHFQRMSIFVLLGLPVLFSGMNLITDEYEYNRERNKGTRAQGGRVQGARSKEQGGRMSET